jgi:peptidyl-prolyl cis-trans isomerase SurA
MWWKRCTLLLLSSFLLAHLTTPCGLTAELVDRIIAYVNNDIITLSELDEKTKAYIAVKKQNPFLRKKNESLEKVRRRILDTLIDDILTAQEVARLNIKVDDSEVNKSIAQIMRENDLTEEAMEAQLRKEGMTMEDIRQQIRQDLERNRLIHREVRSKTVVTEELVEAYYEANKEKYTGKSRRRLQSIFLPFPQGAGKEGRDRTKAFAVQIIQRLNLGADFATMARRYSRGPGAEEGGDLGYFSEGELDPNLDKAISRLKQGEFTQPIETDVGVHIFRLMHLEQTESKPLAEVKESIYRELYQREVDFKYKEWLSSLRERSYIKVLY